MKARANPIVSGRDEAVKAAHADAPSAMGTVSEIALDAIEPDPTQPRRAFDEAKLQSLARSIAKYGLLQLPRSAEGAPRYRLVWGERRWRASRMAGLDAIPCKVLPLADDSAVEQLRTKERQWAENMEREGLSAVEEAMAIQDAVDVERKLDAETPVGELVEKVGGSRGLNGMVARNLIALLKTPRCLQAAVMARAIGREVAFELARHWNKVLGDNELHGAAKREIQFRNLVEAWARSRGMDLGVEGMVAYAAETYQDPEVVKATCRKADDAQRALVARFDGVVQRAQKEGWTVARARAALADRRRASRGRARPVPCFEQGGPRGTRLVVHLDRLRDPSAASESMRQELGRILRGVLEELGVPSRALGTGEGEVTPPASATPAS
jgi:ParB/RepB/Spo0J family partition protein